MMTADMTDKIGGMVLKAMGETRISSHDAAGANKFAALRNYAVTDAFKNRNGVAIAIRQEYYKLKWIPDRENVYYGKGHFTAHTHFLPPQGAR